MIRKIDVEAKVELHELIKTKSLLNDENKIISHIINQLRSPCNARDVGDRTQNYSKLQYNLHRV